MLNIGSGYLASRHAAKAHRLVIEDKMKHSAGEIAIDMSTIESMAESYADEIFGVLTLDHGHDIVLRRLKLYGVKEQVLNNIINVMYRRHIESMQIKPIF